VIANRSQKIRAAATKRALRAQLPQPLPESQIAEEIERYLYKHFEIVPGKPKLAKDLASHLSSQFLLTDKRSLGWLQCIIEFYPDDLEHLSEQATLESFLRLARAGKLPKGAKIPRKFWSPTTRAKRKRNSKAYYELKRKGHREGLIIRQFGEFFSHQSALGEVLLGSRKCDCLDAVFEGKTVKMSGSGSSLENLFGVDRHRFPKNLTKVRSDREIGYNLDTVLQCMVALLSDKQRRWLPDPKFRDTILRRVIDRARSKSDELALVLKEKLQRFLIYSG
jgi:hypothetical protein